jgi:DNA-binding transcriptional ArsR family regulator
LDDAALDDTLRALAHAERRLFLRACLKQERAAGELAELSQLGLASVSEHLKVLRKCGLLTLEVRGRFWMYRTDRVQLKAALVALSLLKEPLDGT